MSQYPIDVTDSITIAAPKALVYQVVSNYPATGTWFPPMQVEFLGGATAIAPGVEVHHRYSQMGITMSDFVRRIQQVTPNEEIIETYDRGSMKGSGVWRFTEANGITTASYLCQVDATSAFNKMVFRILGNSAHSGVYKKLLLALKAHCEALAKTQK